MKLEKIRRAWDEAGRSDPFWSVLTSPGKRGNRWEVSEFLETGVKEIAGLMAYLESLQIEVPRNRALDFGFGPGRLTHFAAHAARLCQEVFQLPGRPTGRFRLIKRILPEPGMNLYRRVRHGGHPAVRVYALPREEVVALCQGLGGRVVDVQADHAAGPGWESFRYCRRRAA